MDAYIVWQLRKEHLPSKEGMEPELLKRKKEQLGWKKQCIQMPEKRQEHKNINDQSDTNVAEVKNSRCGKQGFSQSWALGRKTRIEEFIFRAAERH